MYFSFRIQSMLEYGLLEKWQKIYWLSDPCVAEQKAALSARTVTLSDIRFLFLGLAAGLTMGTFILIMEKALMWLQHKLTTMYVTT